MNDQKLSFNRNFWKKLKLGLIILYWIFKLILIILKILLFCWTKGSARNKLDIFAQLILSRIEARRRRTGQSQFEEEQQRVVSKGQEKMSSLFLDEP